ncbi:uncharacterized protein LOC130700504 [Daphnia carinata]|uniref:uncharacterized protein LOC130700504 n=1 Tax=Daphnia carinata TaxID=120202 RepID=UPI00257E2DDC|nr:uncharacterized protein LOC130700504 [Daphnia carinata]
MSDCNPKLVPAEPGVRLSADMNPQNSDEEEIMAKVPYREAIGSLMYLMVMTRPDIAFAVSQVAQDSEKPGPHHWNAVKRILSYLSSTIHYGLCFGQKNSLVLTGFTDAVYAGDTNRRRSTTGYLFLLNGGPIVWSSRRKTCTAL